MLSPQYAIDASIAMLALSALVTLYGLYLSRQQAKVHEQMKQLIDITKKIHEQLVNMNCRGNSDETKKECCSTNH